MLISFPKIIYLALRGAALGLFSPEGLYYAMAILVRLISGGKI